MSFLESVAAEESCDILDCLKTRFLALLEMTILYLLNNKTIGRMKCLKTFA